MSYADQEWAMAQASIQHQQHIDQGMEIAYGSLAYQNPEYPSDGFHSWVERPEPPCPIGHGPFTTQELNRRDRVELDTRRDRALLGEQDDAYEYLLESLSTDQRDALLVLARNTPKQGLSQLVGALHKEWKRGSSRRSEPERP
ncbi:hypothetical protein [Streptomyces sp. MA5143a]|uniref:hypothetical protein n=1 Tax=Streptomyces sp. MA5143a TaxID=2083010 RepID=UPI000D1B310A|nr:hypothetical protein [Streptomyces sp. MA5143a]SPE99991.1 hypothetical protein SMA5143A_0700 [Streptomyces sp. MA5143a]